MRRSLRHIPGVVAGRYEVRAFADASAANYQTVLLGVQADVALDEIHVLVVVQLQIDDARLAEARDRDAGLCIEGDQAITARDVENACVGAVTPVRQASARERARTRGAARALVFVVHPEEFARGGIERDACFLIAAQHQRASQSAAHREEIRKLLTDEQRVAFDSRHDHKHRGHHRI